MVKSLADAMSGQGYVANPNMPYSNSYQGEMIYQANGQPIHALTIKDIERLAAAGVKMEFESIKHIVRPDPVPPPLLSNRYLTPVHIVEPIVKRYIRMLATKNPDRDVEGVGAPFFISGHEKNGTVFIFFSPTSSGPNDKPVILEDDATVFPSDKLMASIHMLLKANE